MAEQIPLVDYLVLDRARTWSPTSAPPAAPGSSTAATPVRRAVGTEFTNVPTSPTEGEVRAFTIVTFAAPGVPVPFVAAIVDCDGTSVRGNVINVEPDPEHVAARA